VERSRLGTLPPGQALEAQLAGVAHLEEAVALAPGWAAAHAQLAGAYMGLAGPTEMRAGYFPRARNAALRALELDEGEAQAHAALGMVLAFHEWDWAAAERAMRRAMELDSSAHLATYAGYLRAMERYDEAAIYLRMAEERNPLSRSLKRQIVVTHFCAGRYEEAAATAQYVAELWPDLERAHVDYLLGHVHSARSDHDRAIAAYERAVTLSDGATWAFEGLAYGHARAGSRQAARRLLDRLERENPNGRPAPQYVALGDVEGAVALVEADFRERGLGAFLDLRCFPEFSTLRREARIQQILKLVGLPT
jgi:adenylate cyclase